MLDPPAPAQAASQRRQRPRRRRAAAPPQRTTTKKGAFLECPKLLLRPPKTQFTTATTMPLTLSFGAFSFSKHDAVTVTFSLGLRRSMASPTSTNSPTCGRVWTGRSGPATSRPRSRDVKVRAAFSPGVLRLGPFTSRERSCPSPPQKGERDSRPRAS